MKFTPQRMKFLYSIDGVNYSLDFLESNIQAIFIYPISTEDKKHFFFLQRNTFKQLSQHA